LPFSSEKLFVGVNGGDIVDRIDKCRAMKGLSRKDIALASGLKSVQSLTDWSNGSIPQADTAVAVADYLGVSVRWLLTGEDEQGLSLDERNLVYDWNRLTEENQRNIRALMDSMLSVPGPRKGEAKPAIEGQPLKQAK
jgi:transcriptional regulator with XRE-family HTH domain